MTEATFFTVKYDRVSGKPSVTQESMSRVFTVKNRIIENEAIFFTVKCDAE